MLNSIADKELARKRIAICKQCDQYGRFVPKICGQCACFIPAKVKLENSKCPMGKW